MNPSEQTTTPLAGPASNANQTRWQRLVRYVHDRWRMADNAALAIHQTDQLIRAHTAAIARDNAIRCLVCTHLSRLTKRTFEELDAEYLKFEAEQFERLLIEMGDQNPRVADFLDTRRPEDRTFEQS